MILYPGFKGAPKDEPFLAFHNYLEIRLHRADAAVFVGFAFRDEYVNTIIERALISRPDLPFMVVDPVSRFESLPAGLRRRMKHISQPFDAEAVKHVGAALAGIAEKQGRKST